MNKKKIIYVFAAVTAIAVFVGCFTLFPKLLPLVITILVLLGLLPVLNRIVLRKLACQKDPFKIGGQVRNVDYLIIGDMITPETIIPADKKFVQIKAPDRNLLASFEILKHTSSILDEDNGNVVVAVASKNKTGDNYSVFDMPFLYNLTIKKLGLVRLNKLARFPALIKPLSSIKLAFNLDKKKWKETECPNKDIVNFCTERGFNLRYYEN